MNIDVADTYDSAMREVVERLVAYPSTPGTEAPVQRYLEDFFEEHGLQTYTWVADADVLADHPSFPSDPASIDVADRPSVAGVIELGDPAAGPSLLLNGHCDVVPVERSSWSTDPFDPTWSADGSELTARGAADMKAGLVACLFAALAVRDAGPSLDGRIVVESVVGEEEGGIGAAMAARSNPYPFQRDGALVAEPTECRVVTAVEGSLMKRLRLVGRSAHAATRWRGESVLPHFEQIREMLMAFERERAEDVTHPLFAHLDNPWPVNVGTVRAGSWASSVPAELVAEVRIGVAPGETVEEVETTVDARLDDLVEESAWLAEHPPAFDRFSIQFEPAEVAPDAAIVTALRESIESIDGDDRPIGATYGADSRHYLEAGIPTVVFGPGTIEQAHFPDETIEWTEVQQAATVIAETAIRFLSTAS